MTLLKSALLILLFTVVKGGAAQNPVNWTPGQLMEPYQLAKIVQTAKAVPVIISVGPGAVIPGSVAVGPGGQKENLDKLEGKLKSLRPDTEIVIYCGCCPFEHCPNVRPAIDLLKRMNFTHYKLLNLPHNIKADWLDQGYPVSKS